MDLDLAALDHNYALLMSMVRPATHVIASLKGNAYGLGITETATRLARLGVPAFATGSFTDALAVRAAGLDTQIVMFGGALPQAMPDYLKHGLTPTVHNMEIAQAISETARGPIKVYIKVDCGWGRLGVHVRSAQAFIESVLRLPRIELEGLYTHLPFSDAAGRTWAQERLAVFDDLIGRLRQSGIVVPVTQGRSSAGILAGLEDQCTAVSPGALLYGRSPLAPEITPSVLLRPVLRAVRSALIHVSPEAADRSPGTQSRYADQVTGATGVVPFGRADGNRAPLPGRQAHVLIRGRRAKVLGVSSEHAVIDLSDIAGPQIGEEVVILGRDGSETIALADLAASQGTTGSDILLMMSGRIPRVFSD